MFDVYREEDEQEEWLNWYPNRDDDALDDYDLEQSGEAAL